MSDRIRRGFAAVSAVVLLAVGASSCVDNRMAPPPPPVKVEAADLLGTWKGWGGSSVTLRPGGVVEVGDLDGQEFRFDDGWRMTGRGTWSLSAPGEYKGGNTVGSGSVVRVVVKPGKAPAAPPRSPSASPLPTEATARTADPPPEAIWAMGVIKNKKGRLALYFLTSDPDVRDTYYLSRSGDGDSG